MAENKTPALPEGTDAVIQGAAEPVNTGAIATERTGGGAGGGTITLDDTALVTEREIPAPRGDAERPVTGSGSPEGGLAERLRSGREKLASQEHGDRSDHSGRRQGPRAHRVDRILDHVRALDLGAFPGASGEGPRT